MTDPAVLRITEPDTPDRYALVTARSGRILSSTTNPVRATKFTPEAVRTTLAYYDERDRRAEEEADCAGPDPVRGYRSPERLRAPAPFRVEPVTP